MQRFALVSALFFMLFAVPAHAAPKVVASIAPLAGIAAAVMQGAGEPDLLITNNASPHTYQLKPSDAQKLAQAQIVLWVGEGLESFLATRLAALAPKATQFEVLEIEGLHKLETRTRHHEEHEEDEHAAADEEAHHDHGRYDPHVWLNPKNAIVIAQALAAALATLDPDNAALYKQNAEAFARDTTKLDDELRQMLHPLASRGYVVFHDAYQYFGQHYGLKESGVIALNPEVPVAPRHLAALQKDMREQNIACVFAEPQFSSGLVSTLVAGTGAKAGVLNPDASDMAVSAGLYAAYMRRLAGAFAACLTP